MIRSHIENTISRNAKVLAIRITNENTRNCLLLSRKGKRNGLIPSRFSSSLNKVSSQSEEKGKDDEKHKSRSFPNGERIPQSCNIIPEEQTKNNNNTINPKPKNKEQKQHKYHKLIWRADDNYRNTTNENIYNAKSFSKRIKPSIWSNDNDNHSLSERSDFPKALKSVLEQEKEGGRMLKRHLGVLREDPVEDIRLLMHNYTVPALASALRDREEVLQLCATLLSENKLDELSKTLKPFEKQYVQMRRLRKNNIDLSHNGFDTQSLEMIRKALMRMPRRVSQAHQRRAGVVLPLCNVNGVPCILFEKRSKSMRAHADEVCLPGGMVCEANDQSIVSTCLREMEEEIPSIQRENVTVLGVLRCNWGEVAKLTGIAVTPVIGYIGNLDQDLNLQMNSNEVSECFVVPLECILKKDYWIHKEDSAPIFTGGPYIIWGLTGYILDRFVRDVVDRHTILF